MTCIMKSMTYNEISAEKFKNTIDFDNKRTIFYILFKRASSSVPVTTPQSNALIVLFLCVADIGLSFGSI